MHENKLYIIEGTVPAGYPEPGLFQQSLGMARRERGRASLSVLLLQRLPGASAASVEPVEAQSQGRIDAPAPVDPTALVKLFCFPEEVSMRFKFGLGLAAMLCGCVCVARVGAPFSRQLRRHIHGYSGCGQGSASGRSAFLGLPRSQGRQGRAGSVGSGSNRADWPRKGRSDGRLPSKSGDTVKARCHHLRDGSNGCLLGFLKAKDGTVKDWDGNNAPPPADF